MNLSPSSKLIYIIASLTLFSAAANASTAENIELKASKMFAEYYTGNPDENVDSRVATVAATMLGCDFGKYLKDGGVDEVLAAAPEEITSALKEQIKTRRAELEEKLDKSLEEKCDQSTWNKDFNGPQSIPEKAKDIIGKYEYKNNLEIGKTIYQKLKPDFEANRKALLKGDFKKVAANLVKEGTSLFLVMSKIGKIDFSSADAKLVAQSYRSLGANELKPLIEERLKEEYKDKCEPNSTYQVRKFVKSVANTTSNAIELVFSPIETMIEIAVEVIMQGDSESMARLLKDENVSITRHDKKAHEHLQHEKQDQACMDAIRNFELANRRARAVLLGLDGMISPKQVRELDEYESKLLYSPASLL